MRICASLCTPGIHHDHPGLEGGDDFPWGFARHDDEKLDRDIFKEAEEGIPAMYIEYINISEKSNKDVSRRFLIEFFCMFSEGLYFMVFLALI